MLPGFVAPARYGINPPLVVLNLEPIAIVNSNGIVVSSSSNIMSHSELKYCSMSLI